MIEAITAAQSILSELSSLASAASTGGASSSTADVVTSATTPSNGTSFSDLFGAALNRLDGDVGGAAADAKSFASGNTDMPLSDVMVSLEQANLSLQVASGVRDKVTTAYSNVMNMSL